MLLTKLLMYILPAKKQLEIPVHCCEYVTLTGMPTTVATNCLCSWTNCKVVILPLVMLRLRTTW